MKKFEIVVAIVIVISVVLRLLDIPGSFPVMLISLSILSMLYYPFGFLLLNDIPLKGIFKKESYNGKSTLRIVFSVLAGLALSVTVIGLLFKIEFYPGARFMLELGSLGLFVAVIISIIKYRKNRDLFYSSMVKRAVIIGGLALFLLVLPNSILVDLRYPNDPEYAKALTNSLDNPSNKELREIEHLERQKMYQKWDEDAE